jgi:hypothetical protein
MRGMPDWVATILVSAATAVFTGLLVSPRMEARNRRVQAVHQARDKFSDSALTILSACTRLRNAPLPARASEDVLARLQGERERWWAQLEEATRFLVDHYETFALSYPGARFKDLIVRYCAWCRGILLSERSEEEKLRQLWDLTSPVQTVFFARRWRLITFTAAVRELQQRLDALEAADRTGAGE